MNINNYLSSKRVIFLDTDSRDEAISTLIDASTEMLHCKETFLEAILEREKLMSTGVGYNLAFPHAKISKVKDFFVTIGISYAGIDWKAFDGGEVNLIFLIGGLIDRQEDYLKLLAALSASVKSEENRKKLLDCKTEESFLECLNSISQ